MADTISLCILRIGPARFAVTTNEVREVLDRLYAQPMPLTPEFVTGVIPYHGDILPVLSLHTLLGIRQDRGATTGMLVFATPDEEELYAIAVDAIEGITTVSIDSWQENPTTLDPISLHLFRGSFRDVSGLIVRLAPFELAPSKLMQATWLTQLSSSATPETACTH